MSVEVRTGLIGISGARMTVAAANHLGGALLVEGRIEACIITLTGKPRRLPENVRGELLRLS